MAQKQKTLTDRERAALDSYLLNQNADLAYLMSREKPTKADETMIRRMALRWLRTDETQDYLAQRRTYLSSLFAPDQKEGNVDEVSTERRHNRKREDVIRELNILADQETDPKKRADLLMRIAEIEQMKRLEEAAEDKNVTFYIPLRVDRCLELFGYLLGCEFKWSDEQKETAIGIMRRGYDGNTEGNKDL